MDAIDVFNDLVTRPLHALDSFWEDLDPSRVNFRPAGHPNSIAWLLWHTARETDAQIAPLAGVQECWVEQGYVEHFGFTNINLGIADIGLGQTADEARAIFVPETPEGKALLYDYLNTVYQRTADWVTTLTPKDLDRVIDTSWDPPVTLGTRLISVLDDAIQHLGQAAYIAGTVEIVDLTD